MLALLFLKRPWNLWGKVNSLWGKQESFQRKLFETKITHLCHRGIFVSQNELFRKSISSIFLYSVQVNRVATYKELDSYFQKQSALFNVNLLVSVFKSGKVEKSWLFEERKFECREIETLHHLNWTQRILAVLFPQRKHFRVRVTGKSSDILMGAWWTSYFQFQAVF